MRACEGMDSGPACVNPRVETFPCSACRMISVRIRSFSFGHLGQSPRGITGRRSTRGKSAGGSILGFGATVAIASGPAERKTRVRTAARPGAAPAGPRLRRRDVTTLASITVQPKATFPASSQHIII
jgi:hypothetical protein